MRRDLEAKLGDISCLFREKDHEAAKEPTQERKVGHMFLGVTSQIRAFPKDISVNHSKLLPTYPKNKNLEHDKISKDFKGKGTIHEVQGSHLSSLEETYSTDLTVSYGSNTHIELCNKHHTCENPLCRNNKLSLFKYSIFLTRSWY